MRIRSLSETVFSYVIKKIYLKCEAPVRFYEIWTGFLLYGIPDGTDSIAQNMRQRS